MYALPKLINLDTDDSAVTVGITLILQSLYFAGYCVETSGRINTPKGNLATSEDSDCMEFVEGNLLELAIRPLNLCTNDNSSCGCGLSGCDVQDSCVDSSYNNECDF